MRLFIARLAAAVTILAVAPAASTAQERGSWAWPVPTHHITSAFDPPARRWGSGHRGIDIEGRAGDTVRAVAAGTVTFAGRIAGVWTITVTHGAERSTYQPARPSVGVGEAVDGGQAIGTLLASGVAHCASTCLHLGRLRGSTYLDPAELLDAAGAFRLISPDGRPPSPPSWTGGGRAMVNLLGGRVTSAFGMRRHPLTGVWKLHDGVDIGAACGTPVPSFAAGTVVFAGRRGAYGNQVQIRHDSRHSTSYSHLSKIAVGIGRRVAKGSVLGLVGSTGSSTGCHLHFMTILDGRAVNPLG